MKKIKRFKINRIYLIGLLIFLLIFSCNMVNIVCYFDNKQCKLSSNKSIIIKNIRINFADSNSHRINFEKSIFNIPESISLCKYIDSLFINFKPSNDTLFISLDYIYGNGLYECEFQYFYSKKNIDTIYGIYQVKE